MVFLFSGWFRLLAIAELETLASPPREKSVAIEISGT